MKNKVILMLIDGMGWEGFNACTHPFAQELKQLGWYNPRSKVVLPSQTLPCHMSLFHSVEPERHGITTNTYTPMARPLPGLFEQLKAAKKTTAMFYGWEQLRDVARPGTLSYAEFLHYALYPDSDQRLTEAAIARIRESQPDFVFLYLASTDDRGHKFGWMTEAYRKCVYDAIGSVEQVIRAFSQEYTILVTADHGGHDRSHGTDDPRDLYVPVFLIGEDFAPNTQFESNILDIAPTIAAIMGIEPAEEWEGCSLLEE